MFLFTKTMELFSKWIRNWRWQVFVPDAQFVKRAFERLAPFFLLLRVVRREDVSLELVWIVRRHDSFQMSRIALLIWRQWSAIQLETVWTRCHGAIRGFNLKMKSGNWKERIEVPLRWEHNGDLCTLLEEDRLDLPDTSRRLFCRGSEQPSIDANRRSLNIFIKNYEQ